MVAQSELHGTPLDSPKDFNTIPIKFILIFSHQTSFFNQIGTGEPLTAWLKIKKTLKYNLRLLVLWLPGQDSNLEPSG